MRGVDLEAKKEKEVSREEKRRDGIFLYIAFGIPLMKNFSRPLFTIL